MSTTYLYAVLAAADLPAPHTLGLASGDLRCIRHGAVAALVGRPPKDTGTKPRREVVLQQLVAHQRVIEQAMGHAGLLPVKFGTVLADEAAVTRLLSQWQDFLRRRLEDYAHCIQYELVVTCPLKRLVRETAKETNIAGVLEQIAGWMDCASEADRAALGRAVKDDCDRRRAQASGRIDLALGPVVIDRIENAKLSDRMVTNLTLLLPGKAESRFHEILDEIDRDFGGNLDLRCVGPLPPYSFAMLEVTQLSYAAMDAARQMLNIGLSATRDEIKSAYRRRLHQIHPDRHGAAQNAASSTAELSEAFRLLIAFVAARAQATDEAPNTVHCFDRAAIESTILLALRRQESQYTAAPTRDSQLAGALL
jgi:hypothetical protein